MAEHKDEKGTCAITFQRRLDLLLKRLLEWDRSDSQGFKARAQCTCEEGEELIKVQQEMGKVLQDKDHSIKVLQDQLRADYLALLLLLLLLGCRVKSCVTQIRSPAKARDGATTNPAPPPQVPSKLPTPAKLFGDAGASKISGARLDPLFREDTELNATRTRVSSVASLSTAEPPLVSPRTLLSHMVGARPQPTASPSNQEQAAAAAKQQLLLKQAQELLDFAAYQAQRLAAMQQSQAVYEERPGGVGIPPTQLEQRLMGDTYCITVDAGFCDVADSGPDRASEHVTTRALVPAGTSSFVRKASSATTGFRVVSPATSVTSSIADAPGTPSRPRPVADGGLVPPLWEKGRTPR